MKAADDRILEFLADTNAGTPQAIADALSLNNNYVGVRCRKLVEAGLLERPARGLYMITDDGHAFLAADLDASTLPDPDEEGSQ